MNAGEVPDLRRNKDPVNPKESSKQDVWHRSYIGVNEMIQTYLEATG
jgi:hypothetical protein